MMDLTRAVTTSAAEKVKPYYGKVVLSLENCILPTEKLSPTPSRLDGLERDTEIDLRTLGCELIQTSGILLHLPQVAMATGQVLFQRFYYSKSFVRQPMEFVAMACVTLASKIEEAPRRIRDVINVFHHIKQVRSGKTMQPLILDQNYINFKNQVIKAERRVLKELGFCVHVKHPHKIIVTLLEFLKVNNHELLQTAWNYMNDSLRTEVFIRYHPESIACACIYLSARLLQIPLPSKPAWYLVFGVTEEDINIICHVIMSLYTRKKPDPEKLDKTVEQLKRTYEEAKLKSKGMSSLSSDMVKNHITTNSVTSSPKIEKMPTVESKKEKAVENGDIPSAHRESGHKRKTHTPEDGASPYSKRRNVSSSSDSLSSHSSRSPRRKQKPLPRSYKRSRKSRSRSKTRDGKKIKHHSSHKKKVSRSLSRSPHRHSSKKSKNDEKSPYKSNNHNRYLNSGYEKEKHRKDKL